MDYAIYIAAVSTIIALIALVFSILADARSNATTRMQLYLELKTRFLEVFGNLPPKFSDANWKPANKNDEIKVKKYWHHSFDEWYITNKLNKRYMKGLWEKYYSSAILAGLKHNGLRKVCVTMLNEKEKEFGHYTREFENELTMMWKKTHRGGSSKCEGLECTGDHDKAEQEQKTQPTE